MCIIRLRARRTVLVSALALASCADTPGVDVPDEFMNEPVDWDAVLHQQPLSDAASQIRAELEASGLTGFASLTLTPDGVIVGWKGEVPASVAEILERARRFAPVDVHPALHSREELNAAADRLGEFVEGNATSDTPYIGVLIDEARVRVLVAADGDLSRAEARLPRVRVPVAVEHGEPMQLKSRLDDSAPWYGGARILARRNGSIRASCTLGYGVTDGYQQYMLTAAHCATNPDEIIDPTGQRVGWASTKEDWQKDILLINGTSAGRSIYEGGVGSGEYTSGVATWDYVYTGERLCYSGSYGGTRCDFKVESFNRSMYGCDSDGDCYWFRGLVLTSKNILGDPTVGGDSGGPVFLRRADGRVTAKGTLSGSGIAGTMWFAPFSTAVSKYLISTM